jgi:hypothetical protein
MVKNIIHKISAVLVAFALLWIFAGSLVEFHQRYVFHKQVELWQMVVNQPAKDIEKSLKLVEKQNTESHGFDLLAIERTSFENIVHLQLNEKSIFARYLFDLITAEYSSDNIMRGPPAA